MKKTTRTALAGVPLSLLLLLAGACSDDGEDAADTTTTTTEATTTSSETTAPPASPDTTAPPASSETTGPPADDTTVPPATEPADDGTQAGDPLPTDREEWASELIRAWGAGDRDRALELATPEVVEELFGYSDPGGDDWDLTGCDGAAGTLYCTFSSAARAMTVTTQQTQPNGVLEPVARVAISA